MTIVINEAVLSAGYVRLSSYIAMASVESKKKKNRRRVCQGLDYSQPCSLLS